MENLACFYSAPIPVGHRVECRWFTHTVKGWLVDATVDVDDEPVIKDLDTGIEYSGPDALPIIGRSVGGRLVFGEQEDGVQFTRSLVGTVRRCRVVTYHSQNGWQAVTQFHIEPD
jgi:hypothetical protein